MFFTSEHEYKLLGHAGVVGLHSCGCLAHMEGSPTLLQGNEANPQSAQSCAVIIAGLKLRKQFVLLQAPHVLSFWEVLHALLNRPHSSLGPAEVSQVAAVNGFLGGVNGVISEFKGRRNFHDSGLMQLMYFQNDCIVSCAHGSLQQLIEAARHNLTQPLQAAAASFETTRTGVCPFMVSVCLNSDGHQLVQR